MLYLPVVYISRQKVYGAPHHFIDPFLTRKGAVIPVVHHIHSNTGHPDSHYNAQHEHNPPRHLNGEQQGVRDDE